MTEIRDDHKTSLANFSFLDNMGLSLVYSHLGEMKKELVWAIITGFGLGLIITYGFWSTRKALKPKPEKLEKPELEKLETTPTPTLPPVSLTIDEPKDESIIDKEKVNLSGKSDPRAILAIFTEEGELIIEADEEGRFQTEIKLVEGANEITVTAFDDEGNEASQSMTVVYSTAEL